MKNNKQQRNSGRGAAGIVKGRFIVSLYLSKFPQDGVLVVGGRMGGPPLSASLPSPPPSSCSLPAPSLPLPRLSLLPGAGLSLGVPAPERSPGRRGREGGGGRRARRGRGSGRPSTPPAGGLPSASAQRRPRSEGAGGRGGAAAAGPRARAGATSGTHTVINRTVHKCISSAE